MGLQKKIMRSFWLHKALQKSCDLEASNCMSSNGKSGTIYSKIHFSLVASYMQLNPLCTALPPVLSS